MKNKVMWVVIGWVLVAGVVWTVSAYSTNIWSPIQFVKQLFVTPNGELDTSKATIKIDGTNWTIEAKSIYVNQQEVATKNYVDNKVKNIDTSNLTVKNLKTTNGKYLIKDGKIQWVSLTKVIQDYAGWRRWSDGTYARSCKEYRSPIDPYKYAWSIWDGIYWIMPDGTGTPFKVYCDMTTDGGGWTRLTYHDGNGKTLSVWHSDNKYSTLSYEQYKALKMQSNNEIRILYNWRLYYQGRLYERSNWIRWWTWKWYLTNNRYIIYANFNNINQEGIAFWGSEDRGNIVRLGRNWTYWHWTEIACWTRFGEPSWSHHSCLNYEDYIR